MSKRVSNLLLTHKTLTVEPALFIREQKIFTCISVTRLDTSGERSHTLKWIYYISDKKTGNKGLEGNIVPEMK